MKALEEEYEALQRKVWRAAPEYMRVTDVNRLREIRKVIGDEKALRLQGEIRP